MFTITCLKWFSDANVMDSVVFWSIDEAESELKSWPQLSNNVLRFVLNAVPHKHVLDVVPATTYTTWGKVHVWRHTQKKKLTGSLWSDPCSWDVCTACQHSPASRRSTKPSKNKTKHKLLLYFRVKEDWRGANHEKEAGSFVLEAVEEGTD